MTFPEHSRPSSSTFQYSPHISRLQLRINNHWLCNAPLRYAIKSVVFGYIRHTPVSKLLASCKLQWRRLHLPSSASYPLALVLCRGLCFALCIQWCLLHAPSTPTPCENMMMVMTTTLTLIVALIAFVLPLVADVMISSQVLVVNSFVLNFESFSGNGIGFTGLSVLCI